MAAQAGRLARAPAAAAAAARLRSVLTASAARPAPLAALHRSAAAPAAQLRVLSGLGSAPRRGTASRPAASSAAAAAAPPPLWRAKMLYDGDCPLCCREVDMLRRRDAGRGRIAFIDLAAPDYSEAEHGVSFQEGMERIHAILPDGTRKLDVEAFAVLYELVGLGWVYRWVVTSPTVLRAANAIYAVWAKYRLPLTMRPDLATVLRERKTCAAEKAAGGAAER